MPQEHPILKRLRLAVAARRTAHLERALRPVRRRSQGKIHIGGRWFLDFASNDPLNLGERPLRCLQSTAGSASASRLVTGTHEKTLDAEKALAHYFNTESALIFSSGFLANSSLCEALFTPQDSVIADKRIHASLVHGLRSSGALLHTYRHNQNAHLKKMLLRHSPQALITESLFSMDADSPDWEELARLKSAHKLLYIIDEAHALGVAGPHGTGLSAGIADVITGSLGKAFGLFGGFLLLPAALKDALLNFGQGVIYSTALPAWHAEAVLERLEDISQAEDLRQTVQKRANTARELLHDAGFTVSGSAHILTLCVGDANAATLLANTLSQAGICVFAARSPTVPFGKALLRISLSAAHTLSDLIILRDTLLDAVQNLPEEESLYFRQNS